MPDPQDILRGFKLYPISFALTVFICLKVIVTPQTYALNF